MNALRPLILACALAWAATALAAPATPDHAAESPPALSATAPEQLALPPTPAVLSTLGELASLRAATAGVSAAAARADRLRAGSAEWNLRAGAARRKDELGNRYAETELSLEKALRGPAKQRTDHALADGENRLGQLAWAQAWQDAATEFLGAWFGWLREQRGATLLAEQAKLAEQEAGIAAQRLQAGEAARMEHGLALAESQRWAAAAQQAALRERGLALELARRYPAIARTAPATLPAPAPFGDEASPWVGQLVGQNAALRHAEASAEQARLQAQRTGQERRPDPLVGVRASRERGGQENVLGVYVALPLSGAAREAEARAALAQADAAEQQAADLRARVEAAAQRTVAQAGGSQAAWQSLERTRQLMQDNARLAMRAYALGEIRISEALLARRNALEAAQNAEAAQLDALESQSRLLLQAQRLWPAPPAP